MNETKLVCSLLCTFTNAPIIASKAIYNINNGTMKEVASTRVTTKNLKGLVADTSIASICSVTFMEPSSAPMFEPTFPALIKPVTNGASALTMAIVTSDGNHDLAPKSDNEGRLCLVKTIP